MTLRRARHVEFAALAIVLSLTLLVAGGPPSGQAASPASFTIKPQSPLPNTTTNSVTPTISASFSDSVSQVNEASVLIFVDGENVTGVSTVTITETGISYAVPSILKLSNGNQTVMISASDDAGNFAQVSWQFYVNTSYISSSPLISVGATTILLYIGVGAAIAAAAAGGYILYLKRTRRFTFRKYFATHPVKKQYFTLYVPLIAAFIFVFVALVYVSSLPNPPLLANEDVLVAGMFIGLTAYSIDARRERALIRAYERAFAQFLFELADAMRGGLDPAKSVIELSKTYRNVMRKPLRIAADSLRLGRPIEEVLRDMAKPMNSPLISRYAGLIADASTIGGETSTVVYRAAKDMDDFVKIEVERSNQLTLPVAVLYISYGVLMAVLFSLLYIAPELGSISFAIFSGGSNPLAKAGSTSASIVVPKLAKSTLEQRFADLMIINGIGTGIIIGSFTEGKPKYGLIHSLALAAGTLVAFFIIFP